ncbi:hypothetical protein NQ317_004155 [Molorchus minor]|uniref:Uncharacterized protein n=1 Tax=Molorchus minor TaxID=1323400 RepID=A0ABQ9IWY3_9CUCU|nr:hypothetical protein NQ317_004155 [Molorchus minor]
MNSPQANFNSNPNRNIGLEQSRRSTITEYPSRFALPLSPRFTKNIKVQNVLRFSINSRQSVFNTVYSVRCLSCLRVKGSFQEAALIIFPSTPIKNTEDGMKKMAETGQEEGKQNIRIEGALLMKNMFWTSNGCPLFIRICAIVYKIGHPLYRSIGCPLDLFVLSGYCAWRRGLFFECDVTSERHAPSACKQHVSNAQASQTASCDP